MTFIGHATYEYLKPFLSLPAHNQSGERHHQS